jgi:predicted nuclease of predicted toxin-antitoxin system
MTWKPLEYSDAEIANSRKIWRKKARFFIDESLGIGTTEFLKELGWNVKDVSEVGLLGHSDEDVMAYAFREKRIVLSHDNDFLKDRRFPFHRNAGVVILPGGDGDERALVFALLDLITLVGPYSDIYRGSKMEISADRCFTVRSISEGKIKTSRYKFGGNGPVYEWVD